MKKEEVIKLFMIVFKLFAVIFAGLSIYWIYLKLTNHSPTVEELMIAIVTTHFAISVPLFVHIYHSLGEMRTTLKYELRETRKEMYFHVKEHHCGKT